MRYPKDVVIWEYAPDRKLAQVVVKLKNVKGALAVCAQAVADSGVNILTGSVEAPSTSSVATMSYFADVTGAVDGVQGFKLRLKALDVIESVEVVPAEDGFMVDRQHFPVQCAGRRALIMRVESLYEMLARLYNVFGTGAATIIDQMAEAMGRQSAKAVVEDFGKDFAVNQLEELLTAYTPLGYADVSIERVKASNFPLVVHAKELFECEANAKRKQRQKSVFFRAHLRGYMSAIFGEEFDVSEVQCVTEGDDVCSFRVAISEKAAPRVPSRSAERNPRNAQSTF